MSQTDWRSSLSFSQVFETNTCMRTRSYIQAGCLWNGCWRMGGTLGSRIVLGTIAGKGFWVLNCLPVEKGRMPVACRVSLLSPACLGDAAELLGHNGVTLAAFGLLEEHCNTVPCPSENDTFLWWWISISFWNSLSLHAIILAVSELFFCLYPTFGRQGGWGERQS